MSRLKTKSLLAALAAVAAMSIGASAASAAPAAFNIPANSSANAKVSGTVTVKEGLSSVNCTFTNAPTTAQNSGSPSQGKLWLIELKTNCANMKVLTANLGLSGVNTGGAFTVKNTNPGLIGTNPLHSSGSTWYYWYGSGFEAPWANGSGATASKITFNNTAVSQSGGLISFTGSLSVSKADGSLLLLS